MKNPLVEEILKSTPEDVKIFTSWYADLLVRVQDILDKRGIKQKDLAEMLGKKPSEISRWLSGDYNFTLRSLAKLQAELGEPLLFVPQYVNFKTTYNVKQSYHVKRERTIDVSGYFQKIEVEGFAETEYKEMA